MIAAKKEWCNICKYEHIEGNHIEQECEDCKTLGWTCAICDMRTYPRKEIYDIQSVLDAIIRYEKLGFTSDYIHIAIRERIKKELGIN